MTARPEQDARFEIVDAGDLAAVRRALTAALNGAGPPVLPVATLDRERVLRMIDDLTSTYVSDSPGSPPGAADGSPALIMPTSGSTGAPKVVVLTAAALTASARATHRRLGGDGQWLLGLPTSGIAGLQVITRSVLAGTEPVVVAPSARPVEIAEAARRMAGRRYAALVPTQLHRLLAAPAGADVLAVFDAVLLGGAAAPAGLLASARDRGVRVVTTYGMTETAGGCVYDGRPLDGVAVAVDAAGHVRIGGPTVFSGYLGRPIDTAGVLSHGWFATADRGRLDDDGLLRVLGRTDDVVVSGGVNVALPEVSERLLAHPDVADAVAVGVPDDEWGTAVVAFVVIEPTAPEPVAAPVDHPTETWRSWVAAGLGRAHAPRRVVRIAAMPMLGNGKVDRQALVRQAQELLSEVDQRSD
jgi:o-succinylbenzoate---CoA ligase